MFTLHIPKNTGFIYFRKNEHRAKIHIATGAYRKKRARDSILQYREHSESFLSKPTAPNEIALKETKKTLNHITRTSLKNITEKRQNYWNVFNLSFYFLQTLSTRILEQL